MIELTPKAERALDDLREYYEQLERLEALQNLERALAEARDRIEQNPAAGLAAPRPYPYMARPGMAWLKAGRYWISYVTTKPTVITGIFYDAADIPNRIRDADRGQ